MKRYCAALLLFVLLFSLCACHGSRGMDPFEMPESFDDSREYHLSFWAKNDTNKNQVAVYQQAIEEFEKLYPNIHINIRLYTDYGKIYNDVITNIATQTTPHICITYPDHIATYLTGQHTVVPLDGLMENQELGLNGDVLRFLSPGKESIVPAYLEEGSFSGHYYAMPFMRSTEALYINKTYVETLGYELPEVLTWDFIWQVSEAAAEKNPDGTFKLNGQKVMIPFIYKSTDNMMIQYTNQKQSGYSTEDGRVELFNDSTRAFLLDIADHTRKDAFSTFKISSYPANFLNAGQCVFAVDSTAGSTWMGTNAPLSDISQDKLVWFETAVRVVPQINPEKPSMISQGPSICLFNKKDPQEVLASWIFMQYLLTDKVQIEYAQTEGYVPVTLSARKNETYQDYLSRGGENNSNYYQVKIDATKLLLEHTENTFTTPVFAGSASLRDAAGQLVENTVKAVRRKQTVDDTFFENLYTDVMALYRLNPEGNRKMAGEKADLGPLPTEASVLLWILGSVWLLLMGYLLLMSVKKHRKQ